MDAAPAHTQFAATKDLRSLDQEFLRDANQTKKWQHGARSGPGRDASDEFHKTPAGPHPINPRQRESQKDHSRRKSAAFVGDFDLNEEIALAHEGALSGGIARLRVQDQDTDDEDDDYLEYDDDKLPPVRGAANAFDGVIDQKLEEANERAADGEYLLVVDGEELIPTDPAERKRYLAEKKLAEQAEYVLINGKDAKEEN